MSSHLPVASRFPIERCAGPLQWRCDAPSTQAGCPATPANLGSACAGLVSNDDRLAARLSAKLGEGVVNGLMTVRIGIAAMETARPFPFAAVRKPGIGDFLSALTSLRGRADSPLLPWNAVGSRPASVHP